MNGVRRWVIGIGLSFGLVWLLFSCHYALRSGYDSDVARQWTVAQYVRAGIDPYQVALDVLRLNYGEMSGEHRRHLRDFKIYEIHPHLDAVGVANFLPEYGPPTATYPPSPLLILTVAIGSVPWQDLLPLWLVVNLLALAWLVRQYAAITATPWIACAALLLLWPPTHELIRTSQFGMLVMIWLIAALRRFEKDTLGEIVFFTLALLKPSLVLPFFALPLVRARWLTLAAAGGIHVALSLVFASLVGTPLPVLLAEWVKIPGYMLQGAYTVQELINRLGLDNTSAGTAISLGVAAAAGLWCLVHRRADPWKQAALLAYASVLWTYHERYDFILLLIPARFLWQKIWKHERLKLPDCAELAAYGCVVLALTDMIYLADQPAAHVVRWCGRIALAGLAAHAAVCIRSDALKTRSASPA